MKTKILPLLLLGGAFLAAAAERPGWREDFNRPAADSALPQDWEYKSGPAGVKDITVKIVDEPGTESGKALRLDSDNASGSVIANPSANIDLKKTPIMRWRWRVLEPVKPTKLDDQALVIYFGAQSWLRNKSIAYRWESELPKGATGTASYAAGFVKVHYQVLRDAETPIGQWVTDSANVLEDFKKVYGYVPDEFAVSVGANSQYTGSHCVAELDYIEFLTPEENAKADAEEAARTASEAK